MSTFSQNAFAAVLSLIFGNITQTRNASPYFQTSITLHTPTKDLTYSDGLYLSNLVITRDYVNNIGDFIEAAIVIPLGTFMYDVYDYLENIELTIRTRKQYNKESKNTKFDKQPIVAERYKAVYTKDKNKVIPNTKEMSKEDYNQRLPITISLQLIDRSVEAVRIKTTSSSFSMDDDPKATDMLRNILSKETSMILVNNKPPVDFIQVDSPDNNAPLNNVVIPSFTRIIEIPDYIQERSTGCYNDGLGCYIQKFTTDGEKYLKGMWVYPLYDPDKKDTADYNIYCPTDNATTSNMPGSMFKDGVLSILAHKPTIVEDDKEASVMSSGGGFRAADASKYMEKPITLNKKGPIFERKKLNTEIVYKEREDSMNFAINRGVYYNVFALASDVSKRKANFMTLQVSNLDHDVICPGKVANIHYINTNARYEQEKRNRKMKRKGYLMFGVFTYTANNNSPIFNLNGKFIDMTSHATLKYCVGGEEGRE
jgi:hypothetical protein